MNMLVAADGSPCPSRMPACDTAADAWPGADQMAPSGMALDVARVGIGAGA